MKIYIDAACDIHYSSYYIKGLNDYFGKKRVYFSNKYFLEFKHNNHFFAYVVKKKDKESRIIIDFADTSETHEKALKWCDIYAKVNIDEFKNYESEKIVSIGPSFGIKKYSLFQTIYFSIINYFRAYNRIDRKINFFSDYKAQYYRPKLKDYYPGKLKNNYIYFVASLWKKEKQTNDYRANFMRACLSTNLGFEGGFAPRTKNDILGYENLTMNKRERIEDYVNKTKKSILVFNTPAVLDCHGWKLCEFLCFGKVILSTKLTRKLPKELEEGVHVLYTDGSVLDIKEKLAYLIENKELMQKLSKKSREYFEKELIPFQIIKRIESLKS